jgi:hypothetical protein
MQTLAVPLAGLQASRLMQALLQRVPERLVSS